MALWVKGLFYTRCAKPTRETAVRSLAILVKTDFNTNVKFPNFLRTPFVTEHLRWLLRVVAACKSLLPVVVCM